MKLAVVVVGCTLLSAPAWALDPSCQDAVIVESTTAEGVIIESTTPEAVMARRAAARPKAHAVQQASTSPWADWFGWENLLHGILQLLLR